MATKLFPNDAMQNDLNNTNDDWTLQIVLCLVTCFALPFTTVILRVLARRIQQVSLGKDDYMAILCLVFASALVVNIAVDLYAGLGKHAGLSRHPILFAKSTMIGETIYISGLAPLKLSVIFLYRRIFPNRWLYFILWALGIVVVCWTIAADLVAILQCVPLRAVWTPTINARCINFDAAFYSHGAQNVVTDFFLLCLPMPLVWGLQMPTSRKLQLSGILAFGCLAAVASIVRLVYFGKASFVDPTWFDVQPTIWSLVEICMGLTSSCLVTLGPILGIISGRRPSRPVRHFGSDLPDDPRGGSGSSAPAKPIESVRRTKIQFSKFRWPSKPLRQPKIPIRDRTSPRLESGRRDRASSQWKPLPPAPPMTPPPYTQTRDGSIRHAFEMGGMSSAPRCSVCEEVERDLERIRIPTEMA